jgi:hypothetical protein
LPVKGLFLRSEPAQRQSLPLRLKARRLRFGFATLLSRRPLGFFVPYRYASELPEAAYPAVESLLREAEPLFLDLFGGLEAFASELLSFSGPAPRPRWDQDWFPRMDGAMAYGVVRRVAPGRIVEIGSGHSTRFINRAIIDGNLSTDHVTIDPAPRAPLEGLRLRHVAKLAQDVDVGVFRELGKNDILFIDSSHILMPGTDVDYLFNTVLPTLDEGALVHVHDIFLPDDYPPDWRWRGYNEQCLVASLLLSGAFEPLFASHYITTRLQSHIAASVIRRLPLPAGAREGSLWLRKRIPARLADHQSLA